MEGEQFMIKLIGILIVVIGFILKIDTLFTVLLAGMATGIVAGLDFNQIFTILGDSLSQTEVYHYSY